MKNFKKLFLVPVLALGTVTSCYGGNDTKCPEEKKCETCPTPSESQGAVSGLKVTYENGDTVSKELNLLFDSSNTSSPYSKKKLKATTGLKKGITFKSTNERVASVTNDGLITALKANAYCQIIVSDGTNSETFDLYTRNLTTFFGISSDSISRVLDNGIEELTLPEGYKTLSAAIFNDLPRIKKITIPEGYTGFTTAPYDPNFVSPLEELNLPSTFVGTFYYLRSPLPNLKKVTIAEGNTDLFVVNNQLLCSRSSQNNYTAVERMFNGFTGMFSDDLIATIQETGKANEEAAVKPIYINRGAAVGLQTLKELRITNEITFGEVGTFVASSVETLTISRFSTINARYFRKNFINCKNLKEVRFYDEPVDGTADKFKISNGCLCSVDGASLTLGTTQGVIPEGVTTIYPFAFAGRHFVNPKLKIPASVVTIHQEVFTQTNLEKVYIAPSTSFQQSTLAYTNFSNFETNYNSGTYFNRGENGIALVLDSESATFISNILGTFALSNPSLTIYDGNATDRGATAQFTQQARKNFYFDYKYNVTEEEFDTL